MYCLVVVISIYVVVLVGFKACDRYKMNKSAERQSPCGTPMSVTISSPVSFPSFTLSITFSVNFNDVQFIAFQEAAQYCEKFYSVDSVKCLAHIQHKEVVVVCLPIPMEGMGRLQFSDLFSQNCQLHHRRLEST